jgi:hypothetical protein
VRGRTNEAKVFLLHLHTKRLRAVLFFRVVTAHR